MSQRDPHRYRIGPFGWQLIRALILGGCCITGCSQSPEEHLQEARDHLAAERPQAAVIALKNALQAEPELHSARQLLVDAYLALGKGAAAERELTKAMSLGQPGLDLQLRLIRAKLLQKRYGQVLDLIDELPEELSPAHSGAAAALAGRALLALNRPKAARRRFERAAQHGDADGHLGLGELALAARDARALDTHIEAAAAAGASEGRLALIRGEADLLAHRYGRALRNFDRAASHAALELPAGAGRVRANLGKGASDAALSEAKELVRRFPRSAQAHFLFALTWFQAGLVQQAMEAVRESLRIEPDLTEAQLLQSQLHLEADNPGQADYYARLVLAKHPGQPAARMLLAAVMLHRGNQQGARAALEQLIADTEAPPRSAYVLLASLEAQAGNRSAGLELLRTAAGRSATSSERSGQLLDTEPNQRAALAILEQLKAGDISEALTRAQDYIATNPADPLGHNLAGTVHASMGDNAQAERSFRKALELDPAFVAAGFNLAHLEQLAGRKDEAQQRLRGLLEQDPGYLKARLALAEFARQAGDEDEMVEHLEQARRANLRALEPRLRLARWHLEHKHASRALPIAEEAANLAPRHAEALLVLGQAQAMVRLLPEAVETLQRLTQAAPEDAGGFVQLGRVHSANDNDAAASDAFQRALEIEPDNVPARIGLGTLAIRRGDSQTALDLAREVQSRYPALGAGHVLEGDAFLAQGDSQRALTAYRLAFERQPESAYLLKIVQAFEGLGLQGAAIEEIQTWLAEHPEDIGVRLLLADLQVRADRRKAAVESYKAILSSEPNNVIALNNLAWLALEADDPSALNYAARAHELAPEFAQVLDTYGWILFQRGHHEQGLTMLKKARNRADRPEIRYHLALALNTIGSTEDAREELETLLKDHPNFHERASAQTLLGTLRKP